MLEPSRPGPTTTKRRAVRRSSMDLLPVPVLVLDTRHGVHHHSRRELRALRLRLRGRRSGLYDPCGLLLYVRVA